jgi:hypothetical protein
VQNLIIISSLYPLEFWNTDLQVFDMRFKIISGFASFFKANITLFDVLFKKKPKNPV